MEKLPPLWSCTLPLTARFVSDTPPPLSGTFPLIVPPTKTQFWPAEIVRLP